MNDETRANFKINLEYWINFKENHSESINNLKNLVEASVYRVKIPTYLKDIENDVKDAQEYSTLILDSFDNINFFDEELISEVLSLNSRILLFKTDLSAISPSFANFDGIGYSLSKILQRLKNIKSINDLNGGNLKFNAFFC